MKKRNFGRFGEVDDGADESRWCNVAAAAAVAVAGGVDDCGRAWRGSNADKYLI